MIRFQRLTPALLDAWLINQNVPATYPPYRLRLWRESTANRDAILAELLTYVEESHEDARVRLRRGFEDTLSPFRGPENDPAANYPSALNRVTLQGYFGEILAALAVEHWGAHGHNDWVVPAFLFRFHDVEFQHLDAINQRLTAGDIHQPDEQVEIRPGRTGDDGLAFRMSTQGAITDVVALEAKFLSGHSAAKITEAHQKLSAGPHVPTGIRELVNLLSEYDTPSAQAWHEALLHLRISGLGTARRHDGVTYACTRQPVRTVSWLPQVAPHSAYTVARTLEGFEFHFENARALIDTIYRGNIDGD